MKGDNKTKNNFLTGMAVIYFFGQAEAKARNNGQQVAPAVVVGRPWSDITLNLLVLTDGTGTESKSSVIRANNLADCVQGNRWASHSEALGWGIDLSDAYQDFNQVLEDAKTASANQAEAAEETLREKMAKGDEPELAPAEEHESGKSLTPAEDKTQEDESGKSDEPDSE